MFKIAEHNLRCTEMSFKTFNVKQEWINLWWSGSVLYFERIVLGYWTLLPHFGIMPIRYDKIVLTKLIAEIWENGIISHLKLNVTDGAFYQTVGGQKWLLSKQTSHQSLNGAYDDQPFLQSIRVDGAGSVGNSSIEVLTREVADLKSKLHEKEKIIWWLQSNNNNNPPEPDNLPQYQGLKPAASRQNSNPASGGPTRRNLRIHSSPAVLNLDNTALSRSPEANTSNRKLGSHLTRESSAWPGPDVQRRHSSLLPTNNRFSLLADLAEETAVDVMGTEHKAGRKAAKPSKQK